MLMMFTEYIFSSLHVWALVIIEWSGFTEEVYRLGEKPPAAA